jgi:hypothetical protein
MAASIVAETVPGPVTIGAGHVHVSDDVVLSPTMTAVVTASVPLLGGRLRALHVATQHEDGRPVHTQVILPADLRLRVISAIRAIDHPCKVCGRLARWVFDLANASTPTLVICQDCDQRMTDEARAEMAAQRGGTTNETTSENGESRHGVDDER